MLRRRVNDGVVTRLIGKWRNAGVQEKGQLSYPKADSPQGGVIWPLLSNIYLHHGCMVRDGGQTSYDGKGIYGPFCR